ncbi:MAG: hypothetical protein JWP27_499 [Flaviaesturariibacter sp.]|nr:hypothetical protein [Flaviaesturariibacter sp.]
MLPMRYRLTPLNFASALLAGMEMVLLLYPDIARNQHYGYQHLFLVPVVIVGFLIDLVLQRMLRPRKVFVIELLLIVIVAVLNVRR